MLINWFTVAAQIVNFLILAVLLKRFLYGPIVRAMAAREERIASEMAVAAQKRREAEQEEAAITQKMQEIQAQRQEMLAQAERRWRPIRQNFSIRPGRMWLKSNKNGLSP